MSEEKRPTECSHYELIGDLTIQRMKNASYCCSHPRRDLQTFVLTSTSELHRVIFPENYSIGDPRWPPQYYAFRGREGVYIWRYLVSHNTEQIRFQCVRVGSAAATETARELLRSFDRSEEGGNALAWLHDFEDAVNINDVFDF